MQFLNAHFATLSNRNQECTVATDYQKSSDQHNTTQINSTLLYLTSVLSEFEINRWNARSSIGSDQTRGAMKLAAEVHSLYHHLQ